MGEKVKLTAFLVQGSATLIICSLTSLTGFVFAWPSYTFKMYQSNETCLDVPITTGQMSMLGSIINVGALLATPLGFYAVDKIGRKFSAMLFGLPYVISWILISIAKSYYIVLLAVFIAGLGAAGQTASSVYISEIAQDSIRGALTSSLNYGYLIGLLSSYVFGGLMSYYNVLYLHLALSVLYILMLIPLKESPCYLLKVGKEKEARESIAFYRRVDVNSKEVESEIEKINLQLDSNIDNILKAGVKKLVDGPHDELQGLTGLLEKSSPGTVERKRKSAWHFLKKSESSKRALSAVVITMTMSILMGSLVMQVYAESLFKEAIPTMHPNTCAILLAADYLAASLVCASLLDKFGRKTLMTITSILSGIFTIIIGTQLHLHWGPHWFTAIIIYMYSFVFNLGVANVPFVLSAEVFLPEVRGLGNSISLATLWIMNWVLLATFFPLVEIFGLGQTFYIFAIICFIGASYSHWCLPETKGLPADAIQLLFMKKKGNKASKV